MKFRVVLGRVLPLLIALFAVPASAQVLVGPNAEWSRWRFPDTFSDAWGNTFTMGGLNFNPGLRLGYLGADGALMTLVDVSAAKFGFDGLDYSIFTIQPAVAYVFGRERLTSPYVGATCGWYGTTGALMDITRPLIGGAVGMRRKISEGHGLVRVELRYAHFLNNPEGTGVYLPEHVISLRLGADLLVTR